MYGFDPALPPPPYTEHMKLFAPESWERLSTSLANTRETGVAYELELETVRKDGSTGWMWVRGEAIKDSDGNIVGLWGAAQDITDRKRALEALRQSEEKFRLTFAASPDSVNINRLEDGLYVDINQGFTRLTGFTREDVIGKTSLEISIWHDPGDRQTLVHGLRAKGFYENLEAQFRRKDGSLVNALMSATVIRINNVPHIISITRDITELKQAEYERKFNLELLNRLNRNNGLHMLMEQATELMRDWSGCNAVGIRLQEGEDFPYFETRGLPSEFILHENRLCATDVSGELIRDSQGNPVLECMCGNVICGRFDPTLPFFTENGSFWTNSTTDLLSSSSESDRQARTRNRCHGEGYESVALIPLRYGDKILGLLQFNDFRRDRFDISKIMLFERLASNLTIGLVQCQTAEALAKSEEKYRLLIENQNDLVINFDLENRILFVSKSCCKTFGKSENELLGSEFFPLVHDKDIGHVQAALEKVLSPPFETHYEEHALTVNGWRWFAWAAKAVLSADGQVQSIVSVGRDITDRKWAEQALRESEAKFRCLVEGAPNGLYVQDAHNCFVYVNQAALQLFGAKSQDQLLGKPILERFHPDFHDEIQERIRILHEEKKAVPPRERICLRLDGTSVPVESSAVPVVFEGQNWSLVFLQETTERKQMEDRLQQAQKMEAIGALAGGIAHDFNNILFPIIGMSEMLLDDFKTDSAQHENVMMIHNAALRAKDLVNQILSFSRQAGQQKVAMRLQPIIKEVIQLARATIPSNISILQNIRSDCGAVFADPTNLHQVAMNLVTNAFHAVEQAGGSITIELRELQLTKDDAAQSDLAPGAYALLSVADTGHGILPDAIPKIFDPYFTTKPQGKGTGLGLSVCYGIVKDLGGEIKVFSEVGKGTVFKIYLPLLHHDEASGTAPAFTLLPTGSERILVVDDEAPIVNLEKQMLERMGYRVSICTSSHDALEAFRANPEAYDLVLTDMTMPNITGEIMAKKMMAIRADIPVIICTGFSERMSENVARQAGLKGFLMKPLIRSELAKMVRQVLDEAANAKKSLPSGFLDSSTRA